MKEKKRVLELTDFEWRLLVGCLNTARSAYLDEGKPIEDVNLLLIKTLNAKLKSISRKSPPGGRDVFSSDRQDETDEGITEQLKSI